jgi:cysteinyl-tRNA synthetase
VYEFIQFCEGENIEAGKTEGMDSGFRKRFVEAMDDDFNTAAALGEVMNEVKRLNQLKDEAAKRKRKSDEFKKAAGQLAVGLAGLKEVGSVLGLFQHSSEEYFHETKMKWIQNLGIEVSEIESRIAERDRARKEKDFQTADKIRADLLERGIQLKDTPKGTEWTVTD